MVLPAKENQRITKRVKICLSHCYHYDQFVNHNSFFEGSISKIQLYMSISRYFAVHLFRLKMDKSSNHFDSQLPASTKLHSIY